MYHDGIVNPHPPIVRALNETVAALQQAGHEVVEWNPSLHLDLINTVNKLYFLDGGKEYHDIIEAGNETTTPLTKWILEKPCCQLTTSAESWKVCFNRKTKKFNIVLLFANLYALDQPTPQRPPNILRLPMERLQNRRPPLPCQPLRSIRPHREYILGLLLRLQHSRLQRCHLPS